MSDRVVLAPDQTEKRGDAPVEVYLEREVHGGHHWVVLDSGDDNDRCWITQFQARHLARWLRDQGFLDE
jgi:hypothetical protein